MAHGHSHTIDRREESKGRLVFVLGLSSSYMIVVAIASFYTHSLALLADAGHMLSDVGALILALIAIWFASRPADSARTYGYYRTEILAGLINCVVLVGLSLYILWEAWNRFFSPPEIHSGPMLAVAIFGLIVNLISMRVLGNMSGHTVNVKAAYLEVFGDMLASLGLVIASVVMMYTKWYLIDPIVSGLIGFLILPRTWILLAECINILMEGTPGHIDLGKMREEMLAVAGVVEVHDIHVWTITSGMDAMSAHVTTDKDVAQDPILTQITHLLQHDFNINHTTIQVEQVECKRHGPDSCK